MDVKVVYPGIAQAGPGLYTPMPVSYSYLIPSATHLSSSCSVSQYKLYQGGRGVVMKECIKLKENTSITVEL